MKGVALIGYGDVDQMKIQDGPALQPSVGEVLVDIAAAGVNPVDTKVRRGWLKDWFPLELPTVIGYDFSGTIAAVGDGVDASRLGERVMGMVGIAQGGAYAEQIVVKAEDAILVPEGLDLVDAAALPMGTLTGYDLVERGLDPKAGERIVVSGANGAVGRAATYATFKRGAHVIALVRSKPETPISGAALTLTYGDTAALAAAGAIDAVADTVGGDVAAELLTHIRPGGRLVTVVAPAPAVPEGLQVSSSSIVVEALASELSPFAEAVASGDALIPTPRRFPLEQVGAVHGQVEGGSVGGKLLLIP